VVAVAADAATIMGHKTDISSRLHRIDRRIDGTCTGLEIKESDMVHSNQEHQEQQ
jgi:hypothetical protein